MPCRKDIAVILYRSNHEEKTTKNFFSDTVFTVSVQYVTLEKALELGMENNPDIIAARRNLESLARDNTGKWNTFLPNLSLNGSYSNSHNADSNT